MLGSSRETTGGDGRCEPGRQSRRLSVRQIGLALCGLVLLVAGVLMAPDNLLVGPELIAVGGIVLLLGVALPLVNQIELGTPGLAKVSIAVGARRDRMRGFIEDCRGLLVACAADLCPDGESAVRAVEASISKTMAYGQGTDTVALRRYLLCVLVEQARFEATVHSRSTTATSESEPFLRLPLRDREVLVLVDRAGLDQASAARMLGVTESDVASIRTRAIGSLTGAGGAG
jgi:hypothetical protein